MKIIKEGTGVRWKREVTCTGEGNPCTDGCGAILEVEFGDLRYFEGIDYPIFHSSAVIMRCPCCEGITDLERKDWPNNYQDLQPFTKRWRDTGDNVYEIQ